MTVRPTTLEAVTYSFSRGDVVYVQGASGELRCLQQALEADPAVLAGVTLVSGLIPGMNQYDYAALHPEARVTTFLLPSALRPSFGAGQVRVQPLAYSEIGRQMARLCPDVAILHLTPPIDGQCSFGVCADFGPLVAPGAKRLVGVINSAMPRPLASVRIPFSSLDAVVEVHEPLQVQGSPSQSATDLETLAAVVANLVPDGACVQTGIGAAPDAVWRSLAGHRNLRLHSGMVTEAFIDALDAGAMASWGHVAGVAFGGARLRSRLDGESIVRFDHVGHTHTPEASSLSGPFIAINSALEIDLFGQANLEWQGGRLMSGVGGAPDFAAVAQRSVGGRSILALPATAKGGTISRIVPRLPYPASLARSAVDTVVTEYGEVRLSGLSIDERASALIALAGPEHRDVIANDWDQLRRTL